jgi:hypothetical protein
MTNKNVYIKELIDSLDKAVAVKVSKNTSKTAITVSSGGESKTYIESAFSGCGMINFHISSKDWKLAKTLGGAKSYRNWSLGGQYYNGQYGDACSVVSDVLDAFKAKYSDNIAIQKIDYSTWID